jgi:hypothetical protein
LLELIIGEFGVIQFVIVNLVNYMEGLGLRRKAAAQFLNGPGFLAARSLPEQPGRFLWAALTEQGVVKSLFELHSTLRFARRIVRTSISRFRCPKYVA